MPNDALIDRLASDLKPVSRHRTAVDVAVMLVLCAAELGLFLGMGMMRDDMPTAIGQPAFWWKLISLGLIAGVGGAVAVLSFDPVRSPRRGLRWVAVLVGVCLMCGWVLDAARVGWPSLVTRLDWPDGVDCVETILLLSLPPLIALGVLMRRGAPTEMRGTAVAVGLAAAAWGAFVFVFSCPFDDPLYVAVWYALACSAITLLARAVLPVLARW